MLGWLGVNMPDVMGTLPAWISAGGIISLVGILLRNQQINRKLAAEESGSLRAHTAGELHSLREQVLKMGQHHLDRERELDTRWRKALEESEARHHECLVRAEELGSKLLMLEEQLTGTKRQFVHFQQRLIEVLPMEMRETVRGIQPFVESLADIESATLKAAKKTAQSAQQTVREVRNEENK